MKSCKWIVLVMAALTLVLSGCNKNKANVDTAPVEKSFASAEPATKTSADKAVSAIKSGDYAGALVELKTLAANAKLTPEQQQSIKDVIAQVQNALAGAATKVQDDATKAVGDLQKSLPK